MRNDAIGATPECSELVDIQECGRGDILDRLAGEKTLVAGYQDIWESGQTHENIVVNNRIGEVFKKDAGLFFIDIDSEGADAAFF